MLIPCMGLHVNRFLMPQNEIFNTQILLNDLGLPQNFGWSRRDVYSYEPLFLYAPRHSTTKSDRYIVFSPTHMVVFEMRDDGWLGHMSISIISLRDKKRSTQAFKTFVPLGSYDMPSGSVSGRASWRRKKTHLDFICMEGGARIVKVNILKFGHNRYMRGALVLTEPVNNSNITGVEAAHQGAVCESLVTNQSWRTKKNTFRYTRCSPWYNAEGVIQFGSTEIIFTRGNAWGILDWNRSARPNADIRYWASACGQTEGRQVSFCVGYSMADSSRGTENGFFVDGKLHKLDQVTFHIPLSNWLSPWRFTSNDNRLEMTFYPHQERIDRRRFFLHNSTRRQVCGFFSGKAQLDDGSLVHFQNLTGFAERSKMNY